MASFGGLSGEIPFLDKKYRKLLFYSRFVLLYQLFYYGDDGIAYGALKDTKSLGIPAGSLSPNLLWLKGKKYVVEKSSDGSEAVYYITEDGKAAFAKLRDWLKTIFDVKSVDI